MTVTALTPETGGRWWVHTEYSTHLFDLDEHIYKRLLSMNEMRKDQRELDLELDQIVNWPKVGERFRIIVHVSDDPAVDFTIRTSSLVTSIERAEP